MEINSPLIRKYEPADFGQVVSLFTRAVHEVNCRDYSAEQIHAWAPETPDMGMWAERLGSGGVFVCERNGALAGFMRIVSKADRSAHLDLLFVHPEGLGRGIGRALMERAISWAAEHHLPEITSDVSLTARAFFERHGFRVVTEQTVTRQQVAFHNFKMERLLAA